jgi:hypothetical protein
MSKSKLTNIKDLTNQVLKERWASKTKIASTIEALQKYCIENAITVDYKTDGSFSTPKFTPESILITELLNNVKVSSIVPDFICALNSRDIDISKLAARIAEDKLIILEGERPIQDREIEILKHYMVNAADEKLFDWKMMARVFNVELSKLISDAFNKETIDQINSASTLKMTQKAENLLTYGALAQVMNSKFAEIYSSYYVDHLDVRLAVDRYANYYKRILTAIARSKQYRTPSYLFFQDGENLTIIEIRVERKLLYVRYICDDNSKKLVNVAMEALDNLIKKFSFIKLEASTIILKQNFLLDINNSVLAACLIADIAQKDLDEEEISGSVKKLQDHEYASERLKDLIVWLLRQIKAEDIVSSISEKDEEEQSNPDMEKTIAARTILELLRSYKPNFFDFFGYDISGKRKRMINNIIELGQVSSIGKVYGDSMEQLESSLKTSSKLYQDLILGLLIDRVIEDSKFSARKIESYLHPSIINIAKAAESEYKNVQLQQVLEHAHDSINAMQYELADIMFKTLSSAKEESLTENISADFNNWLSEKKTVINQQPNKMHKQCLRNEMHEILESWLSISGVKLRSNYIPNQIEFADMTEGQLGAFVHKVCSIHARGRAKLGEDQSVLVSGMIYVEKLPKHLQKAHQTFVGEKHVKLNAQRILAVLSEYKGSPVRKLKNLNSMFNKILKIISEEDVYQTYKQEIDNFIVRDDNGKINGWKYSPKEALRYKSFVSFIRKVFQNSDLPLDDLSLNKKLKRLITGKRR